MLTHHPDHVETSDMAPHRSHTILVAIDVVPTVDRYHAMRVLEHALLDSDYLNPHRADTTVVESWHLAEDDRCDGSFHDGRSAVFCTAGRQAEATDLLRFHGLA